MWYAQPATYWNSQSLHLGNAHIGASFFGGVGREQFALTEGSMWTGGPFRGDWEQWGVQPGVSGCIREIRQAVAEGNYPLADSLSANGYLGQNELFGHFTSIGDLFLEMDHGEGEAADYVRSLDLSSSLGKVAYTLDGVSFEREYFCSYPHRILAMKFRSGAKGRVGFRVGMDLVQEEGEIEVSGDRYVVRGRIDGGADRPYVVEIRIQAFGGSTAAEGDTRSPLNQPQTFRHAPATR